MGPRGLGVVRFAGRCWGSSRRAAVVFVGGVGGGWSAFGRLGLLVVCVGGFWLVVPGLENGGVVGLSSVGVRVCYPVDLCLGARASFSRGGRCGYCLRVGGLGVSVRSLVRGGVEGVGGAVGLSRVRGTLSRGVFRCVRGAARSLGARLGVARRRVDRVGSRACFGVGALDVGSGGTVAVLGGSKFEVARVFFPGYVCSCLVGSPRLRLIKVYSGVRVVSKHCCPVDVGDSGPPVGKI